MQEDITAEREIAEDPRALKLVAPAYAGKSGALTAALQYVYQVVLLGRGHAEEAKRLEKLAAAKLFELEKLGTVIRKLGADPVFTACPPYPVSYHAASAVDYAKDLPAMLEADLRLEHAAIERYSRMLSDLEDPALCSAIFALKCGCEESVKELVLLKSRL